MESVYSPPRVRGSKTAPWLPPGGPRPGPARPGPHGPSRVPRRSGCRHFRWELLGRANGPGAWPPGSSESRSSPGLLPCGRERSEEDSLPRKLTQNSGQQKRAGDACPAGQWTQAHPDACPCAPGHAGRWDTLTQQPDTPCSLRCCSDGAGDRPARKTRGVGPTQLPGQAHGLLAQRVELETEISKREAALGERGHSRRKGSFG